MRQFNFGKNWKNFSRMSLTDDTFRDAQESLRALVGEVIPGSSFIDIGSGSGIFSIAAHLLGAKKVVGLDISSDSIEIAKENKDRFAPNSDISFIQGSILENEIARDLAQKFNIVYSWGVLHHTGDMWRAIENTMELVATNGLFVIAIYNKHWSSPLWWCIKYIYNIVPRLIQKLMIWKFYLIIYLAKFLVTFKNPLKKGRGMNFYYDVVDWLGGYPYEYASKKEIVHFFSKHGFDLITYIPPGTPIACHQLVFVRISNQR